MQYSLSLTFITQNGSKSNITIADVKSDLSNEDVTALVKKILELNIFTSKNGPLISFHSAMLTEKNSKDFDIQLD